VSDIDTAVVDSLKALDLNRPIREAALPCLGLFNIPLTALLCSLRRLGSSVIR
jgi:hypothetical protein